MKCSKNWIYKTHNNKGSQKPMGSTVTLFNTNSIDMVLFMISKTLLKYHHIVPDVICIFASF